ncbi:hypothetical protein [Porphyromonas canoris]|uniref:Uncharacterized protein n=1 Tax=Porphyromonas canoris TaxID=36875 RepID=A0ABR4XMG9_9PORP|nr:hypothetical protein [Porphyromonas canoris]KGN93072.1 hypothetical protein HQ43_02490 [Porphyromonas canoris]
MAKKKNFRGQEKKFPWPRKKIFVAKKINFRGQEKKFPWPRKKIFMGIEKNFHADEKISACAEKVFSLA